MKQTWNGMRVMTCDCCGFATVDEAAFDAHVEQFGHKQPEPAPAKTKRNQPAHHTEQEKENKEVKDEI